MDIPGSEENFNRLKELTDKLSYELMEISAATNSGLKQVFNRVSEILDNVVEDEEPVVVTENIKEGSEEEWKIRRENNIYVIEGKFLERVMKNVNFDDYESIQYFQRILDKKGINKKLEEMGINEGDTVRIGEAEFEYIR